MVIDDFLSNVVILVDKCLFYFYIRGSSVIKDNFMMKLVWNLVVQTLSLPLSGRKVHV